MKYSKLGKTNFLNVSKMCFGTLTLGPLQKNLPVNEGGDLLRAAKDLGINFFDTAEVYKNYEYLRNAFSPNEEVIIATKSYAYDKKTADKSVLKYLTQTKRERIEIMLLHEQESIHTLRGHAEALEYFFKLKEQGLIGFVGLSTHCVSGVLASLKYNEIEVIHPLINFLGLGILDGTAQDMLGAITKAHEQGKGIYAMKPLGGGHLIPKREQALKYINSLEAIDSVAVGVADFDELNYNAKYFAGEEIPDELAEKTKNKNRSIIIQNWCTVCGNCINTCKSRALAVVNNKLVCDKTKCVFCGYCGGTCRNAAIKVI